MSTILDNAVTEFTVEESFLDRSDLESQVIEMSSLFSDNENYINYLVT